jgi:starch synthase
MKILYIAAESRPFITVGGLGEVAYELVHALAMLPESITKGKEMDIRLALPFHAAIEQGNLDLHPCAKFYISYINGIMNAEAFEVHIDGIPVYLISGPPIPKESGPIYASDAALDGPKYAFFSVAALGLAHNLNWKPDILHANDWHTAPAIYALSLRRATDEFFANTSSMLTVHNLPYLGSGAGNALNEFGLPPAHGSPLPFWAQNLPLPLGLLSADQIVAVSPGYANEILTPEFGSGLDEFLKTRADSVTGIINGIDLNYWNPEVDNEITFNFSINNTEPREGNKTWLQKQFGLEVNPRIPMLGVISRLDNQKGIDLVMDALLSLAGENWQAIILGTGRPELENAAKRLESALPTKVRTIIAYDKNLSRRIYGGADALLIPSRYEPCGLVQMIAMRYGCIPIARATGGLKDTIIDSDGPAKSTGFLFETPSPTALSGAIRRALIKYADKNAWQAMQKRAMEQDFSWTRSAEEYYTLYKKLITKRRKIEG